MRIDHLSLKNWRNFKSVEIKVGDRLFVVGPNASGKSNLLDALRFLGDVAGVGGGLQHAVAARGGIKRVRCLNTSSFNRGWVGMELSLKDGSSEQEWTYQLHFASEPRGAHRPLIRREVVLSKGVVVLERPDRDDEKDTERLTQTALEQVNSNRRFRAVADFLNRIRYLHPVPQIIRDPGLGHPRDDAFGSNFLARIARTAPRTRNSRLNRVNEALRLVVPQLDGLSLERDEDGTPHLEARYQHWREHGARQNEQDFSDGTLRLIGLLWLIQESSAKTGGVILLEQPEMSLHGAVVRRLPTILNRAARRNRAQVILSTHSNEMLEDSGLGLDEVVVLQPGDAGTNAKSARDIPDAERLLEAGLSLAEILEPLTTLPRIAGLSRVL